MAHEISDKVPEKVKCHMLRHSKAVHLLQAGVNLIYIRDFLGHSDIKTTETYARADIVKTVRFLMIGYKTITVLRDESSSIIEYPAVLLYTGKRLVYSVINQKEGFDTIWIFR